MPSLDDTCVPLILFGQQGRGGDAASRGEVARRAGGGRGGGEREGQGEAVVPRRDRGGESVS